MPKPPSERASERSPWAKSSNIRGSISGGMPTPLSRTRKTTSPPSTPAMSWMCPPDGVYLAALVSRFTRICSSRVGSASSRRSVGREREHQLVLPLARRAASRPRRPGGVTGVASMISLRSWILPCVMRETSSRSSMRWAKLLDLPADDVPAPVEVLLRVPSGRRRSRRCGWRRAGSAARGRAWRGTRSCGRRPARGRPSAGGATPRAAAARSCRGGS